MAHLTSRSSWSLAVAVAAALASAEWLHAPGPLPAGLALAAAVVGMAFARGLSARRFVRGLLVAAAALGVLLGTMEYRRLRFVRQWDVAGPALQRRIASLVQDRLDAAAGAAGRVAAFAAALDTLPRERGFDALEAILRGAAPVRTVAVLSPAGRPLLWAGAHRTLPVALPDSLSLQVAPFASDLEVRRRRADGGSAVAAIRLQTLAADAPAEPTLLGAIEDRFGVTLGVGPPGSEPVLAYWPGTAPVLAVTIRGLTPAAAVAQLRKTATPWLVAAITGLLLGVAIAAPPLVPRLGVLLLVPWAGYRAGLADLPTIDPFFSPAVYFSPVLGPLSTSAGALILTGSAAFLLAVILWHRPPRRRPPALALGLLLVFASPYVLREFGRGITPPAEGVSLALWFVWHLGLLLPATAMLVAAAAMLRDRDRSVRPLVSGLAIPLALLAALAGILAYTGRPAWPAWYTLLWVPPLVLAARPAPRLVTMAAIGAVAGAGAGLMTWGGAVAGRTDLALRDIASVGSSPDPLVEPILTEFGAAAVAARSATTVDLFRLWSVSALRRQGYPIRLSLWSSDSLRADLRLDLLGVPDSVLAAIARETPPGAPARIESIAVVPGLHSVLAARTTDSLVLTVAVGPRTRLIPASPLRRLVAPAPERLPQYRLALAPLPPDSDSPRTRWRREGWALRSTRPVAVAGQLWEAGAFIPIGRPSGLVVRGALLLLLDMALVGLLWVAAERIAGVPRRRLRWREVLRSYQGRLAIALGAFAVLPAAALTALTVRQLASESVQSRDLVLQRILRDAAPPEASGAVVRTPAATLAQASDRVDAGLALYVDGAREAVSDPLLADLGIFPALLDPPAYHSLHLDGDLTAAPVNGATAARLGYATIGTRARAPVVLATAVPANDAALRERQADVAFLLLLLTLLSAFSALALARAAARTFSRPVENLRNAALAFGQGRAVSAFAGNPPAEFAAVFEAFGRMASDVRAGQAALESARRRTERVLETVSTGVLATDGLGHVTLINRHASEALGLGLAPGDSLERLGDAWAPLVGETARVRREGGDGELELEMGGRQLAARVGSLEAVEGGVVIALTDITEATRAARVLAWADIANQVAHAIKNPLTPLRLGVQHLQRVASERPGELGRTLPETAARVLAEIDRLDGIARAFSRFAAPLAAAEPLEPVDGAAVLREAAALYRMAPEISVEVDAPGRTMLHARREELVEVLVNLLDNARNAGARNVLLRLQDGVLEVQDDGHGVPADHLARIFEPRFSTTSSGAGLGLAVVRRLVESWGAEVSVASAPGAGATFRIRFPEGGANIPAGGA